jgi:hypothetical protein
MISTLSGNVNNFAGMVAIRFFIGFVEAAFLVSVTIYDIHPSTDCM